MGALNRSGVDDLKVVSSNVGTAGITSVALLKNTFTDKDDWRNTLTQAPFGLSGTDFATKLKIGKLISVYESASSSNEVQIKADAERIFQNLPPTVTSQAHRTPPKAVMDTCTTVRRDHARNRSHNPVATT